MKQFTHTVSYETDALISAFVDNNNAVINARAALQQCNHALQDSTNKLIKSMVAENLTVVPIDEYSAVSLKLTVIRRKS